MALKIDGKYEGKLTFPFKKEWRISEIFIGWKIVISF